MKKKENVLTVIGNNRFKDELGRIIIHDPKKGIAYLVTKKEKNRYKIYEGKWLYALTIGIILGDSLSWPIGIGAACVLLIILESLYRNKFLPSLQTIENEMLPRASNMYERNLLCSFRTNFFKAVVSFTSLGALCFLLIRNVEFRTIFLVKDSSDTVLMLIVILILAYNIAILTASLGACFTQRFEGNIRDM